MSILKHLGNKALHDGRLQLLVAAVMFGMLGVVSLIMARAAVVPVAVASPQKGVLAGGASIVRDSSAVGGSAVDFTNHQNGGGSSGSPNNMIVGVNINGMGSNPGPDMAGAVPYVRADLKSWGLQASTFANAGIKVDDLLQGPYSTSGISGLGSAATWAANALGWYKADGCTPALCPIIEVLNEPGGTWFWGSNALSEANATAYDDILVAAYNAFASAYGSSRPLILASFDGGYSTGSDWGKYMWQANAKIGDYIDGITVHPYDTSSSGLGSQSNVTNSYAQAKSLAGRSIPMYITEVGWQTTPTSSETAAGDTPLGGALMTPALQCNNIYNFISWARNLEYVKAVMIFDYRDDNSDDGTYGIEYGDGTHKPSYAGIAAASRNKTNPCP